MQFSQNPALSEPAPGGKLQMYNGTIDAEYVSLEENKQIVMKWRFKDWEEYSKVVINFEDNDDVRIII